MRSIALFATLWIPVFPVLAEHRGTLSLDGDEPAPRPARRTSTAPPAFQGEEPVGTFSTVPRRRSSTRALSTHRGAVSEGHSGTAPPAAYLGPAGANPMPPATASVSSPALGAAGMLPVLPMSAGQPLTGVYAPPADIDLSDPSRAANNASLDAAAKLNSTALGAASTLSTAMPTGAALQGMVPSFEMKDKAIYVAPSGDGGGGGGDSGGGRSGMDEVIALYNKAFPGSDAAKGLNGGNKGGGNAGKGGGN